jgi:hypothetical protein
MKLDRNLNPDGRGKYALLKLRKFDEFIPAPTPSSPRFVRRKRETPHPIPAAPNSPKLILQ